MTARLDCVSLIFWKDRPAIGLLHIVNTVTLPLVGLVLLGLGRHPFLTIYWDLFAVL